MNSFQFVFLSKNSLAVDNEENVKREKINFSRKEFHVNL